MANEFHKPILEGKGAPITNVTFALTNCFHYRHRGQSVSPRRAYFQVVHSLRVTNEGAGWELGAGPRDLSAGNYPNSARLMRRANAMLEHPIALLHILETITPYDYHIIRAGLGHGSGLDSPGFLSLLHIAPESAKRFKNKLTGKGLTADDVIAGMKSFCSARRGRTHAGLR